MSYVTHLESALDGTIFSPDRLQSTHRGRPLWVRYDLEAVASSVSLQDLAGRPPGMWRYRELLPLEQPGEAVSLGEAATPLLDTPRLAEVLGLQRLSVKDESRLPTGSFKARGMAMAVGRARELGATSLAVPTAGNAGGALAAYAAAAGIAAWVFMPSDTPSVNQAEASGYGAAAFLIDGLITDCGDVVRAGVAPMGWFDVSTLKEPYRLEGKKTMGFELADQLGWRLPDVILYPTGGGTGLIGMWKAFAELEALGWLAAAGKPRMIACQTEGCAPIVRAFENGKRFAEPFPDARTAAFGIRVPAAVGDFMILDAIRASGGEARAAGEDRLLAWARRGAALEGIAFCPETGACLAVLEEMIADGSIHPEEHVVVFNTGAAHKYVEVMSPDLPVLGLPVDWSSLVAREGDGPAGR